MQLKNIILLSLLLNSGVFLFGQGEIPVVKDPIEINFLSNYYYQDGNHSAVGGGIGSEKLSNITQSIVVNIPVKRNFYIGLSGGLEFFSSASQNSGGTSTNYEEDERDDDDDDEYYSGASPKGQPRSLIGLADFSLLKKNVDRNMDYGFGAGFYKDGNASSLSATANFSKSTKDDNHTFSLKANYFHDQWQLSDPGEIINGDGHLGNGVRQTFGLSTSYSHVINKRLTAALMADVMYQTGLLSTPYHRVYFADNEIPAIERLPKSRLRFPVAVQLNYHASDFLILQAYYRFYYDTWNIKGHTVSLEVPLKITPWLRAYPFYRFHQQSAASHFSAYSTLNSGTDFYTADYDLSSLQTHKTGLGLSITPINRFFKTKNEQHPGRAFLFKSIDVRYAFYARNDGLTGHMITGGLSFNLSRD